MDQSDFNTVRNTAASVKSSRFFSIVLILLAFCGKTIGQTTTTGTAYTWSTTTSWLPTGVPTSGTVTVNHPLTLNQDLSINNGNYTFNNDVTDQPGGTNYTLTNSNAAGSLTIASGTTTIGGITNIGGNQTFTLTVKRGATLVLGTSGSLSNNFLIGNNVQIDIQLGGAVIVYGNIVNSNSSGNFIVNGLLQVYGNYATNNGKIYIDGTTGQFYTTGSMSTQGSSSTIYNSENDCSLNCSGTSLSCGTGGNSYTATIAPPNQTVCSGGAIPEMTFTTNTPSPSYIWEYSLSAGGTYNPISDATSYKYTPTSLTVTTWYRVKYTSNDCGIKYSAPVPVYVSASTYTQSTAGQTLLCGGSFGPISVSAFGTGLTYQWYSTDNPSNSNGTLISGATSYVYVPSNSISGTKYYYCVINSSCSVPYKTAISGAFSVNTLPAMTATICSGGIFTASPSNGTNGVVPSGTNYTWVAPVVAGITGTAPGNNAANISGTLTNTTNAAINVVYTVTPKLGTCTGSSFTVTVTVNPKPAITAMTATICSGGIFTASPSNGTNGVVPSGTNYTWVAPVVAGITGTTPGNNAANISGTLTNTTNSAINVVYTVTPKLGTCTGSSFTVTVTVNPTPVTAGTITGTAAVCQGQTSVSYTVPAITNAASYTWSYSGTGATIIGATNTPTITFSATATTGNLTVYGVNACGNGTISANYAITVNPAPVGGTATATSANLCPGSSTTISLSGNTGAITKWQSSTTSDFSAVTDIVNPTTTQTATNLTVTTYYRAVITSGSCTANSATATVTVNTVTKTWDGVPSPPWFVNGVPMPDAPTINHIVIINEDFNTSSLNGGDLNAGCLTINTGKKLTITAGKNVTIQNDLTIKDGATLEVLDQGSLRMVEDSGKVTNIGTGKTEVHRFTTPYKKYDYVYWSTPVKNTAISSAINTPFQSWRTNYAFEYKPENFSDTDNDGLDDDGNDWSFVDTMIPGKGYIVMVPDPPTVSTIPGPTPKDPVAEVVFSGEVNNGKKIISTIVADASYLLGNPYPSAIDADLFLQQNQNTLGGTLYFWTHNTAIRDRTALANAGSGAYAYTSDDYATYNGTGGVGVFDIGALTGSALSDPNRTVLGLDKKPTGKIAAAQGFFASSLKVPLGDIVFNNSMRVAGTTEVDGTGVNQQFFRTSATAKAKTASVLEKHRIWLDLKNSQGAFKQTLVGYISGATNDYDNLFDGASYDGNDFVDFYSINQDMNLTIQGRAVPFDENDTVPLGFKTTIAGSFTINIDQVDGDLTNQAVYLEDKLTNTLTNLKTGDYTFTTATGTFDDRFVLRYTDKTLGLNETEKADGILVFYSNNYKTLIIKNNVMDATVNSVALFNTTGQGIANFDIKDSGQTNLQIPIKNIASGIYIVKVKTTKGESSKKIIVN